MLLLNLATIRTPHERFDEVYSPAVFAGVDDRGAFAVTEPVTLGFDLFKDKDRFRLAGRIQTTLELPCSRCLESFKWPVDETFDLRFQPRTADKPETEREIEEDDFSTAFYDDDTIELGDLMREQFYLSMPMKPLCSDACHGLCAQCGTNLNRTPCDCARAWEDPRFAALKALRDGSQENQ
jgi:DUF177 domain-containing protein